MSTALKKMSIGMGLGLLGGILAIAAVAYSWDGSFQSIVPVGLNLLIATMFFATAGSFAKSAPVAGKSIAIIAAVGRKMASRSGSSGKIFQALGESGVNIRMISQGPEELNIIIGVKEKDFNTAVSSLYHKFVQ